MWLRVQSTLVPYPESFIREIADRHGLVGGLELLPKGGMVNEAWAIGDGHILRIVMEGRDPVCDTEAPREAVVVPLLNRAGVTTPRLVAADMEFAPRPYTIYERAPGELIGFSAHSYGHYEKAWRQLGRDYVALHSVAVTDAMTAHVTPAEAVDVAKWVGKAFDKNAITRADADDIVWTAAKWALIGGPMPAPCLVHNDVHPWNLMGDPATGRLTAILDWGDASLGDRARDFAMMPLQCVPAMLEGYRESSLQTASLEGSGQGDRTLGTTSVEGSQSLVARALVVGLSVALFEVRTPEMSEFDRRWWRMPPGGWPEMKSLVAELFPDLA